MRVSAFGRVQAHTTTVRDTVEGMSDTTPGPGPAQPEPVPPTWPAPSEPAPPAWAAQPEPVRPTWPAPPEPAPPAWATAPPPVPDFPPATVATVATATDTPAPAPAPTERPRLNALAVAALILAVLFSPLAALFGHIAAAQIARSNGRERGAAIAWISVGLGYLWLVSGVVLGYVVWQLLGL